MCVQRLRPAQQISQLGVYVTIYLRCAGLGSGLNGVVAALMSSDIDVNLVR